MGEVFGGEEPGFEVCDGARGEFAAGFAGVVIVGGVMVVVD
jgi:hypothetical protein